MTGGTAAGLRQGWLVALREMRERIRSNAFRAGLAVMLLVVVAMIVVPAAIDTVGGTKDVGLVGAAPAGLTQAIRDQGASVDITARLHRYRDVAGGRDAVRDGEVDVLVVDARRLEWQDRTDEQLQAVVSGAIQVTAIRARATQAGIDPDELVALVAPVPVENVEIGLTTGHGPDDGTAVVVMTGLLLVAISTYGNLVLIGVVEEKSSRVVEVLLARIPARNLLAGKVAGIGLLGLIQFAVTALAAFAATLVVESFDISAVSGDVLVWVVVWFVLGYALYAMTYGALGSLASRMEDASTVSGPAVYVLLAGYFASFVAVSEEPEGAWSRLLSYFPATAPFAMPGRVALGAAQWWEPVVAAGLALAALAGLVVLAGRVYTNAILHTGPTLRLRDAWREPALASAASDAEAVARDRRGRRPARSRWTSRHRTG
jgi:ABC-2 type transport system permease protein